MSAFPTSASDLNTENLTALLRTLHPDICVDAYKIIKELAFGDGREPVSTAGRVEVELTYSGDYPDDLPTTLIVKVCRPDIAPLPLYRNEVAFYLHLRNELGIEAPRCLGGVFDETSATFGLALEDLRLRGVTFPNVKSPSKVEHVKAVLTVLAKLHAHFWDSSRFDNDLSWVNPHVQGELYELFNHPDIVPAVIEQEVADEQFKRELVQSLGRTPNQLYQEVRTVQLHQSKLTPTLCHGDTHVGNTYALLNGEAGLYDWQLIARGYCMHDVSYVMITGLSVEDRRAQEASLIAHYLDQLSKNGVANPPNSNQASLEYQHAAAWCLYIGWLTTPIDNYGWDITVCNIIRLTTAYRDLGTKDAVAQLPAAPPFTDS